MPDKIVFINGEEAIQLEGVTYVTDNKEVGYFAEGYPTDMQLQLQDSLDGATQEYVDALIRISNYFNFKKDEQEHDMSILNAIREEAFDVLKMHDIY